MHTSYLQKPILYGDEKQPGRAHLMHQSQELTIADRPHRDIQVLAHCEYIAVRVTEEIGKGVHHFKYTPEEKSRYNNTYDQIFSIGFVKPDMPKVWYTVINRICIPG
jgi:hypothetical protein